LPGVERLLRAHGLDVEVEALELPGELAHLHLVSARKAEIAGRT